VAVRAENRQHGTADAPLVSVTMAVPVAISARGATSSVTVAVAVVGGGGRFRVLVRGHLVRVRNVTTLCNHARAR